MTTFSDFFGDGNTVANTLVDSQIFTTSGTWTKPVAGLPSDKVIIQLWGGGGGGRRDTSGGTYNGGGGGAYSEFHCTLGTLQATVAVIVGAGGTYPASNANGNPGGASKFGVLNANGGTGGSSTSVQANGGVAETSPIYEKAIAGEPGRLSGADLEVLGCGGGTSSLNQGRHISLIGGNGAKPMNSPIAAQAPGGGGASWNGNTAGGDGARGEVRVYVVRS